MRWSMWLQSFVVKQKDQFVNLNLNLKKVYSTENSVAHCKIAVSKITKSSGHRLHKNHQRSKGVY